MQILVALAEIYGADEMIPVGSVQIAGVSFHNLGEAGLQWLEEMARDGQVRTLATLNPAGMDLENWRGQGVSEEFAERQLRLVRAYEKMGIAPTCTCTPYLIGNLPAPGEHIAWAESSAVAFANSVLGARTNREGGPSALAAALTGRTPRYGLHLAEERIPSFEVVVEVPLESTADWSALGCVVGRRSNGRVTLLRGVLQADLPALKSFGAALVTFGGSPLYYLEGITSSPPDRPRIEASSVITSADLAMARTSLDDGADEVDLVSLGCPHMSLAELAQLADLLDGREVLTDMWICTARPTAEAARQAGYAQRIEKSGAKLVCDTCFAVAPLQREGATVATDSAKGCYYGRGHNRLRMHLGSVQQCVAAALTGRWK
jgi:predicted aconitase